MLRLIDIRLIYTFVSLVIVPVCLLINANNSRSIAYRFYRQRLRYRPLKAAWNTYLNHCIFGQVVVDKFAMYAGKKFDVTLDGYDNFLRLASLPEGFIQLSAHIGNYEIAGYTLVAESKVFNAVVFAGEKESVMTNRTRMFESKNIRMIPIKQDMSHLFEINNALERGETVSMPADRINGSPRSVEMEFLGAKARFPQGPFSVATMRGLDVLAVTVMKESLTKYHIYVTPLEYDKSAMRKEQVKQLAKAYVRELEDKVHRYPHQWYNYYDFWSQPVREQEATPKQYGRTYGGSRIHAVTMWLAENVDIRTLYTFQRVCIIPIALIVSPGARLTYRYYHDKRQYSIMKSLWATYKNNSIFGETVTDKYASYASHKFPITYHGLEEYQRLTSRDGALLQLSAHIGCSEILGYSLPVKKRSNILAYGGEKQTIMKLRRATFEKSNINIITVGTEESSGEEIARALDKGEIIISFADRFFSRKKTLESSIHGHRVYVAKGPMNLAVTRGLDVIMVNAMKEPDGTYSAYFTPLYYDRSLTKKEQRQQLADAYTAEIERLLDKYPYQWFNYFNMWRD